MGRKQVSGFAIIATVLDTPDTASTESAVNMFYAAPNPIVRNSPVTLFWETVNIPKIQILGPNGFDTGPLPSSGGVGYYLLDPGPSSTKRFTLVGLQSNGQPIIQNGSQLTASVQVAVI
jgi:hypothetical protein